MIALVDYGAGNLSSVRKALAAVGARFETPAEPSGLREHSGIIVPGVGHFSSAAALQHGWREAVAELVARGVPLLGICLGMQWLFDGSDEAPGILGLGALAGTVQKLDSGVVKVPHVGWNTLDVTRPSRILDGVPSGTYVYFTHSYAVPLNADTVAETSHAVRFASVVESGAVAGVQFHPEKSGDAGLRILRNFVELSCSPSA